MKGITLLAPTAISVMLNVLMPDTHLAGITISFQRHRFESHRGRRGGNVYYYQLSLGNVFVISEYTEAAVTLGITSKTLTGDKSKLSCKQSISLRKTSCGITDSYTLQ
jgi:hypothetical protein